MKIAIMQPYFFPYIGYFDLINHVDIFVFYDVVQYPKQGWVNRNRILHQTRGWEYITVPMEKSSFTNSYRTPITDIRISESVDWRSDLQNKISRYEEHAPYYEEARRILDEILRPDHTHISQLNIHCLQTLGGQLDLDVDFQVASQLDIKFSDKMNAQQKVLLICEQLGADIYINLPGGRDLYEADAFLEQGIDLQFLRTTELQYPTNGFEFEPNLSLIDVLMWNSCEKIKCFLKKEVN